MSETNDEVQIGKAYAAVKETRATSPCARYESVSRAVELCLTCGWDEDAHIDVAQERDQ